MSGPPWPGRARRLHDPDGNGCDPRAQSGPLQKMPYDPVKDFAPISLLVVVPNVLVVNPDFPAKNVQELIELAEGEARASTATPPRQRDAAPPLGRAVQAHGRGRHGARPLQGGGAGAGRRHGRPRADHVRQPPPLARAYPGQEVARPRGHHHGAGALVSPSCRPSPRRCPATRPTPGTPSSRRPARRSRLLPG